MDNKKAMVIFVVIISVMVTLIIMSHSQKEKTKNKTNNVSVNVQTQNIQEETNRVKNEVESENTLDIKNTTTQNEVNATSVKEEVAKQQEIQGEEEMSNDASNEEDKSEKAINLVKEEWGEDDTVYYTLDNQSGSIFNISVRSKATTMTLAEYEVDVNSNTVNMK